MSVVHKFVFFISGYLSMSRTDIAKKIGINVFACAAQSALHFQSVFNSTYLHY